MECKYREEITGKRFLSVRSCGKLKATKISEWEWRSGIVRAVTHKDFRDQDISVRNRFLYVCICIFCNCFMSRLYARVVVVGRVGALTV